MRVAGLLLLLAGCDAVFLEKRDDPDPQPGESATHDEDGDGTADAFDLCPHANPNGDGDGDGDGIGDDCDPRRDTPDRRLFFAFADGDARGLTPTGIFELDAMRDAVLLGATSDALSYLTVDGLAASTIDVVLHMTFEASAREQEVPAGTYSEIGIASFHRSHVPGGAERGDICFVGSDLSVPPNYLEFDEDDADLDTLTKRFDSPLVDAAMTLAHVASRDGFDCMLTRASEAISNVHRRQVPREESGTISIDVVRARVRLHYLWIVAAIE